MSSDLIEPITSTAYNEQRFICTFLVSGFEFVYALKRKNKAGPFFAEV